MSITIKDIAKLAGVSHTTVSRAINDSPLISESRKKNIREIATKYGYAPNHNAKSLVLNKSFNIGVFFTTLNSGITPDYFFQIIRTLQKQLKGKYKLVVRGIDDYKEEDYFQINKKTFDGIITVSQDIVDDKFIYYVEKMKIPQVIINRKFLSKYSDCIYTNEKQIVKKSIKHLIDLGHTQIAFIKGTNNYTSTQNRISGYLDALKENSINVKEEFLLDGDYNINSGFKAMHKILSLKPRPTALFFGSDNMALGALKYISQNNLCVPKDFSIIGFDNAEFTYYLTPSLTTIERPNDLIVNKALKCLLNKIEIAPDSKPLLKCIPSRFIERESTSKI